METLSEDKQVVELISKLKYSNGTYPKDLLNSRRQQFIHQVANAGLGIGVGAGLNRAAKHGRNAANGSATLAGKVLESVLIAAIALEAGTTAYIYRHQIADFFKTLNKSTETGETIQQPNNNSSLSQPVLLPTLTPPSTSETPSAIASPLGTSLPQNNNAGNNNTNNNSNTTAATPAPTDINGNHYGQTPKPEQTKDGNNTNNNLNSNTDTTNNTNGNNGHGNK